MSQNFVFEQLQYVETNKSYFKDIIFGKPGNRFYSLAMYVLAKFEMRNGHDVLSMMLRVVRVFINFLGQLILRKGRESDSNNQ